MTYTHDRAEFMTNGETGYHGWTGLINSMIGFTNAAAMFGIQQMQNAAMLFTDSRRGVDRFKNAFDSLSGAMENEMNADIRSTTEEMNRATMVSSPSSPADAPAAPEALAGRKR